MAITYTPPVTLTALSGTNTTTVVGTNAQLAGTFQNAEVSNTTRGLKSVVKSRSVGASNTTLTLFTSIAGQTIGDSITITNNVEVTTGYDSGTSTANSAGTLTDTGKSWTASALIGLAVWIKGGAYDGAFGTITENTATTISVILYMWNNTTDVYDIVVPEATVAYAIGYSLEDLYQADVAGGWGIITRLPSTTGTETLSYQSSQPISLQSGGFISALPNSGISIYNPTDKDYRCALHTPLGSRFQMGKLFDKTTYFSGGNGGVLRMICVNTNKRWGVNPNVGGDPGDLILLGLTIDTNAILWMQKSGTNGYLTNSVVLQDVNFTNFGSLIYQGSSKQYVLSNLHLPGVALISPRGGTVPDVYGVRSEKSTNPLYYSAAAGSGSSVFRECVLSGLTYLIRINFPTLAGETVRIIDTDPSSDLDTFVEYVISSIYNPVVTLETSWGAYTRYAGTYESDVRVMVKNSAGTEVLNALTASTPAITEIVWRSIAYSGTGTGGSATTNVFTDNFPFTVNIRKYGYISQTVTRDFKKLAKYADDSGVVRKGDVFNITANAFVSANEATAAAYSGIAISGTDGARIITLTSSKTPQQIYDYLQWWLAQSANIGASESIMLAVSAGLFNLGTTRIVIASGGTLTVDTDEAVGALVFGNRTVGTNGIKVQSGGELVVGQVGSLGRSIDFTQDITDNNQTSTASYANIYIESGGNLEWVATEIQTHILIAIEGDAHIYSTDCTLVNDGAQVPPSGNQASILLYNAGIEVDGLTLNGIRTGFNIPITAPPANIIYRNTSPSAIGISSSAPDNSFITMEGLSFDAIGVGNFAFAFWSNQWMKMNNLTSGTELEAKGNSADSTQNEGLLEVRQEISFDAESGAGAKFYTKDTNNGSRLAASQIGTNADYTADRAYTLTESGGTASYTTDGGILTGVFWRTTGGLRDLYNNFDSRGIANDKTDIFNWLKVQYGYQPTTLNVEMKGIVAVSEEINQLPDSGITQATRATVAAYTGIACNYATGTLTVTVTVDHTWNEVYDYIKYWENENPANVWANGKASFVSTSNKINYTYSNLVVVVDGCDMTAVGQVLPTDPTVTNGGFFESASIVLKDFSGTTKTFSHYRGQIVKLSDASEIENAVFAYGDETAGLLTYDTSWTLGRLVADADGLVEGYLEYGVAYTSTYSIAGYYGFAPAKVPRSLNGLPIGTALAPEVTRLAGNAEVTKSRTDAGSITGVVFADGAVDGGDNVLADIYDRQEYLLWATTGYIYGTMLGCMEYCLNGRYIEKSGTNYTGRDTALEMYNFDGGGTVNTGTYLVGASEVPSFTVGTMTLSMAEVEDHNFASVTFVGTVDFHNASGEAKTIQVASGVSYTRSGSPLPTVIEPLVYQSVTVSGGTAGSRLQIYDTTASEELYNGTPSFPYTWTDADAYSADRAIRVRISYMDGTDAKLFFEQNIGTATEASPSLSVNVTQIDDTVYSTNAIDGSTVTDIEIVDGSLLVEVDTGTMTWASIYAYNVYWLFTEEGIRDEGSFIDAPDTANYKFYDFQIKNITSPSVPLYISGGYGVRGETGSPEDLFDDTGGSIFPIVPHVVSNVVTVTGGNVITGDIADVPTAVWAKDLSGKTAGERLTKVDKKLVAPQF